jgi:hypothetical protein
MPGPKPNSVLANPIRTLEDHRGKTVEAPPVLTFAWFEALRAGHKDWPGDTRITLDNGHCRLEY